MASHLHRSSSNLQTTWNQDLVWQINRQKDESRGKRALDYERKSKDSQASISQSSATSNGGSPFVNSSTCWNPLEPIKNEIMQIQRQRHRQKVYTRPTVERHENNCRLCPFVLYSPIWSNGSSSSDGVKLTPFVSNWKATIQMGMFDIAEIESRPLSNYEKRSRVFVLKIEYTFQICWWSALKFDRQSAAIWNRLFNFPFSRPSFMGKTASMNNHKQDLSWIFGRGYSPIDGVPTSSRPTAITNKLALFRLPRHCCKMGPSKWFFILPLLLLRQLVGRLPGPVQQWNRRNLWI